MAADSSDLRVITTGPGIHEVPSWSPSGRRIVFDFFPELVDPNNPEGFAPRLWTMHADGSKAKPLPMDAPGFRRRAPICAERPLDRVRARADHEQRIMDADGTDIVNLINTIETFENWPSWGPAPRRHHDDDFKRPSPHR